jgi:ketosteroid isomerase-like protein
MSEQNSLGVVRMGYDAFGRGDINGLLNLLDDNVEWITPGPTEIRTAGTRRGRQAVGEFFKTLNETFEITNFQPKEFIAQGDRVIVLGTDTARIKATGKTLDFNWVHSFTVKNDKIVNFTEYGDMSAVAAELKGAAARV